MVHEPEADLRVATGCSAGLIQLTESDYAAHTIKPTVAMVRSLGRTSTQRKTATKPIPTAKLATLLASVSNPQKVNRPPTMIEKRYPAGRAPTGIGSITSATADLVRVRPPSFGLMVKSPMRYPRQIVKRTCLRAPYS